MLLGNAFACRHMHSPRKPPSLLLSVVPVRCRALWGVLQALVDALLAVLVKQHWLMQRRRAHGELVRFGLLEASRCADQGYASVLRAEAEAILAMPVERTIACTGSALINLTCDTGSMVPGVCAERGHASVLQGVVEDAAGCAPGESGGAHRQRKAFPLFKDMLAAL